jgi:CxxC-x17-CxxC domain-containing protein
MYDRAPREMHKAVCADCGKECEVPFKPTEGRPVYCRDCYEKHRPARRSRF